MAHTLTYVLVNNNLLQQIYKPIQDVMISPLTSTYMLKIHKELLTFGFALYNIIEKQNVIVWI